MLYVAPVVPVGSVGVICCPTFVWGFLLGLFVAPLVRGGFCWCYMMPQKCVGVSIGVICCPSYAWGLLLALYVARVWCGGSVGVIFCPKCA